jgi:hypothetical protein
MRNYIEEAIQNKVLLIMFFTSPSFSFLNGRNFILLVYICRNYLQFSVFFALSPLIELKWSTICVNRAVQLVNNSTVDIEHNMNDTFLWGGIFSFCSYNIQHCFICRPPDSTVPTDAGIEPRTVASGALAVRRSNH